MDKTCKICGFTGDTDLFKKNRRVCKKCYSNIQAQNRAKADKKEIAEYQQRYRQANLESLKDSKKQYYELNKISINNLQKIYYQENSEIIKHRNAEYRKNHKSERNAREKDRRDTNPAYKLRVYLSRDIFRSIKSKKGLSTFDLLPYSVDELKVHLEKQFEPWMTWENHGKYDSSTWDDNNTSTWTWQIDHIIPRSKFVYTNFDEPDFIECWSLSNLRPLSAKVNLISGSKLSKRVK